LHSRRTWDSVGSVRPPVTVICFDLGGVLVRICSTWEEACARAGVAVRRLGEQTRAARHAVVESFQRGQMSSAEYFAEMAQAFGGAYHAGELARVHDAWLIEDMPGAAEVVRELNQVGSVVTACLSNTNAIHWPRLRPTDGSCEFPAAAAVSRAFASHLLGVAKPSQQAFELVEQALGVGGPQIVLFDDLAENVHAARRAGWLAQQVDPLGDVAGQMRQWLLYNGVLGHQRESR